MNVEPNPIAPYQSADGRISLAMWMEADTICLRQEHMSTLFGRERSVSRWDARQ